MCMKLGRMLESCDLTFFFVQGIALIFKCVWFKSKMTLRSIDSLNSAR
jgi:hypothetical protein